VASAKNRKVLWLGRGAVPPALERIALDAGFSLELRTAPAWPAARVAWLQSLPSTNRDNSSLARRRIAILHPDPGAADALAEAVRAKGARAIVLSLSEQGLIRAEALDPEVIILSPAHLAGACRATVEALWAHKRLRWAPMLLVPDERLGPAGLDAPDVRELAISVGMLCAEHVFLGRRAQMESYFEVALHQLGPTRTLAALVEAGRPLRACFRSEQLVVEVDVTEGIVVGARAGKSQPDEETLLGVHALAALYDLSHATVVVRHVEHPAVTNVMAPLDALLLSDHRAPRMSSDSPKVDVDALLVPALPAPHVPRAIADAKPDNVSEPKPAPAAVKTATPALAGQRAPGQPPPSPRAGSVADLKKTLMGVGLPPLVAPPPTPIRAPSQPGLPPVPTRAASMEGLRKPEKSGESGLEQAVASALGAKASHGAQADEGGPSQVEAALVEADTPTRAFTYSAEDAQTAQAPEEIEVKVSEWPASPSMIAELERADSEPPEGEFTETWMMPVYRSRPPPQPAPARRGGLYRAAAAVLLLVSASGLWWGWGRMARPEGSSARAAGLSPRAVSKPPPLPVVIAEPAPVPGETATQAATPAAEVVAPVEAAPEPLAAPEPAAVAPVAEPPAQPAADVAAIVTPEPAAEAPAAEAPAAEALPAPTVPVKAEPAIEAPAKPEPSTEAARATEKPEPTEAKEPPPSEEALARADEGVLRGHKLRREGDLAGARIAYLDALDAAPGYPRALAGLAETYLAQKDSAHALTTTLQLLTRRTRFPDDYRLLGDVYMLDGRTTEAADAYLKGSQGGSKLARERLKAMAP